ITAVYSGDTNYLPGSSNTVSQVVNAQAAPGVTALSPSSVLVGSPDTNVLVNGSNFVAGSAGKFNTLSPPRNVVCSTLLIVSLPKTDFSHTGGYPITVTTPGLGGSTSAIAEFMIVNPSPVLISAGPDAAIEGDPAVKITLSGVNFVDGSVVKFGATS